MNALRIVLASILVIGFISCAKEQPAETPETASPAIAETPAAEPAPAPDTAMTSEEPGAGEAETPMETTDEATSEPPPALDRKLVARGQDLFRSKCASCHGEKGAADTDIARTRNLKPLGSDEVQRLTDEEIATILRGGKDSLSARAHQSRALTEDEIEAVTQFIRSLR